MCSHHIHTQIFGCQRVTVLHLCSIIIMCCVVCAGGLSPSQGPSSHPGLLGGEGSQEGAVGGSGAAVFSETASLMNELPPQLYGKSMRK